MGRESFGKNYIEVLRLPSSLQGQLGSCCNSLIPRKLLIVGIKKIKHLIMQTGTTLGSKKKLLFKSILINVDLIVVMLIVAQHLFH